ncbi:MAG: hypothetical protein SNG10_06640 [Rikenellaceae bacterium]
MKKLVYRVGCSAGFFSEYNNMLLAYHYCLVNDIEFILDSEKANFASSESGGGWCDFFEPFCEEYRSKHLHFFNRRQRPKGTRGFFKGLTRWLPFKLYTYKMGIDYYTYDLFAKIRAQSLDEIYEIPQLGIKGRLLENCRALHKLVWRYNAETQREVDAYTERIKFDGGYVGFHVRWGDKHIEADLLGVEKYVEAAQRKEPNTKNYFIFTDDYTAVEQLRADHPDWHIETLCGESERGYIHSQFTHMDKNFKRQAQIKLFASVDIIERADLFVGTYSSNPGMNIGIRMEKDKIVSLDVEKWCIW